MIRSWTSLQMNDNDLPEHYVIGEVDGIAVSLQVRVGAPPSVLNPLLVSEKIAIVLDEAGVR